MGIGNDLEAVPRIIDFWTDSGKDVPFGCEEADGWNPDCEGGSDLRLRERCLETE